MKNLTYASKLTISTLAIPADFFKCLFRVPAKLEPIHHDILLNKHCLISNHFSVFTKQFRSLILSFFHSWQKSKMVEKRKIFFQFFRLPEQEIFLIIFPATEIEWFWLKSEIFTERAINKNSSIYWCFLHMCSHNQDNFWCC